MVAVVSVAACLAGCGGEVPGSPVGTTVDGLAPPPAGQGIQLNTDHTVQAGEEAQFCTYFAIPPGGADISHFEHRFTTGSHHILLNETSYKAGDVKLGQPFDCKMSANNGLTGVAYASQLPSYQIAYPDGVALHLEAGAVVMVQLHLLNVTAKAIDTQARVNLWFSTSPVKAQAGSLFYYHPAILVPPLGQGTARMHCTLGKDITLIGGSSHMHHRAVSFEATLGGPGIATPQQLYATSNWEAPEPRVFPTPLALKAGQSIDFRCDYKNPDPMAVIDGPSAASDEMCIYSGAYYPRADPGTELCFGGGSGAVFAGTATCAQTVTCLQSASGAMGFHQCLSATCEKSSPAIDDFTACLSIKCGTECSGGGAACTTCVASKCAAEYGTCQQASCS